MERISAVYKIMNTVTGDFYVGSSSNVMKRWADHKCPSTWKNKPNKPLYQDMQKYGVENFRLQLLAPVIPEYLKQVEQELIDMLHPTYNQINAKGWNVERYKESQKKYYQKVKEAKKKYVKEYQNQLCEYNCETLTLSALNMRFRRAGIEHPTLEAKKYLIKDGLIQC